MALWWASCVHHLSPASPGSVRHLWKTSFLLPLPYPANPYLLEIKINSRIGLKVRYQKEREVLLSCDEMQSLRNIWKESQEIFAGLRRDGGGETSLCTDKCAVAWWWLGKMYCAWWQSKYAQWEFLKVSFFVAYLLIFVTWVWIVYKVLGIPVFRIHLPSSGAFLTIASIEAPSLRDLILMLI